MICQPCGQNIPASAQACPFCGEYTSGSRAAQTERTLLFGAVVVAFAVVIALVYAVLCGLLIPT